MSAPLYLKQMELGPMQNYVYLSSEGGTPPFRSSPQSLRGRSPRSNKWRSDK